MDKTDRSLTLSWPLSDRKLFFIRFRIEKDRSPSVFAAGSVRYICVPASRWALGHGLHRLCLNLHLVTTQKTDVERSVLVHLNKTQFVRLSSVYLPQLPQERISA
jgi:hypothetical protein